MLESSKEVETEFFYREMNRLSRMNGESIDKIKEQYKLTSSEVNELSQKISEIECINYVSYYFSNLLFIVKRL